MYLLYENIDFSQYLLPLICNMGKILKKCETYVITVIEYWSENFLSTFSQFSLSI